MLCRLYSLLNCSFFKAEWAPIAHHVMNIGESFPWDSILSLEIRIVIQVYQKVTARKKLNFFFSSFIIDIFCTKFHYPNLGWNLTLPAPPVPIYHAELWDTNYVPRFYDICEKFLGCIYFLIFKKEAPAFSTEAKNLIATMGDWYVGDSFAYFIILGSSVVHMFPKAFLDRLFLEEVSFKSVTEGVYKRLSGPKRKGWRKFPLYLGSLAIPT